MNTLTKRIAVLVAIFVVAASTWFFYHNLHATSDYSYRIEFTVLPPDDAVLQDWLRAQPGVSKATVTREGKQLLVSFEMPGSHTTPDVLNQCGQLGYQSPIRLQIIPKN